jgi:hypothetical protein
MQINPNKNTPSDIKMKSLMRCLSGCKDLFYRDQPTSYDEFDDSCYNDLFGYSELESFENEMTKINLLKDIIALADVARSKTFTTDTSDRELLSDIFTEIFVKAHEIRTILNYGTRPATRSAK